MDARVQHTVYIVSDASGDGAWALVSRMLEQFPQASVVEERFRHVSSYEQIEKIMEAAAHAPAMVFYTFAERGMVEKARSDAARHGVCAKDLFDSITDLGNFLEQVPVGKPGHDPAFVARYLAVDFVARTDDGQNREELSKADMVITGLSRSGKTPVCRYLGQEGIRAANVPIVPNDTVMIEALERLDPDRIYVLDVSPDRLAQLRATRINPQGMAGGYADREEIRKEVLSLMRILGRWHKIDANKSSVEEIATAILEEHRKRFPGSVPVL